jgi:hypothetical protein
MRNASGSRREKLGGYAPEGRGEDTIASGNRLLKKADLLAVAHYLA